MGLMSQDQGSRLGVQSVDGFAAQIAHAPTPLSQENDFFGFKFVGATRHTEASNRPSEDGPHEQEHENLSPLAVHAPTS